MHRFPLCYLGSGNWFWASIVLNSVAKVASVDSELLLPHRDVKSMGGCLAICVTLSCCALTIAVNLLIGGGNVLSLLRVVGPVFCVSGSSSSSLLIRESLSESEFSGS